MLRTIFTFLLLLMVVQTDSRICRSQTRRPTDGRQKVEQADLRPDLTAPFDEVARLKIVARKTNYRIGEMITLDIALLNTSSRYIFFRKLSEVQINVRNSGGKVLRVQAYGVSDRALVPNSFIRLPANEMMVRSFQLLVGCDRRAFSPSMSSNHDSSALFRGNLFLSWGDACLAVDPSETLTISAEIKNAFVVSSSAKAAEKTAVGAIKSNLMELTID